jgi:hypothetical protein
MAHKNTLTFASEKYYIVEVPSSSPLSPLVLLPYPKPQLLLSEEVFNIKGFFQLTIPMLLGNMAGIAHLERWGRRVTRFEQAGRMHLPRAQPW